MAPRCLPCLEDTDCSMASRPYCYAVDGRCVACLGDGHCAPNECASDARCLGGDCDYVPLPVGTPCSSGICDGDALSPECVACMADADCDDGDPCTADTCGDAACVHVPS